MIKSSQKVKPPVSAREGESENTDQKQVKCTTSLFLFNFELKRIKRNPDYFSHQTSFYKHLLQL